MFKIVLVTLLALCGMVLPSAHASYQSGVQAFNEGDYAEAISILEPLAQAGDVDAQAQLGLIYGIGGHGVADRQKSIYWTRKAAVNGDARAQSNLGSAYCDGEYVEKDLYQCAFWRRKAAEKGDIFSLSGLGSLYYDETGIKKDLLLSYAFKWLASAPARAGEPDGISEFAEGDVEELSKILSYRQIIRARQLVASWEPGKALPTQSSPDGTAVYTPSTGIGLSDYTDMEISSMRLFISPGEVRIDYVFKNLATEDKELSVFVLYPVVTGNIDVFKQSNMKFNGSQTTLVERSVAFNDDDDISNELVTLGLALDPEKIDSSSFSNEVRSRLYELYALNVDGLPRWKYRHGLFGLYNFKAGVDTTISISYRPSVDKQKSFQPSRADRKQYCMDRNFVSSVGRMRPAESASYIDFELNPNPSNEGTIRQVKDFSLVIEKPGAGGLVSLCAGGLQKIGPTRFEMHKGNFPLEGELSIVFVGK